MAEVNGQLRGKMYQRHQERTRVSLESFLRELPSTNVWKSLPPDQQNFKTVLSGESDINLPASTHILGTNHLADFMLTDTTRRNSTVHRQYDTGVDLKKLATERPTERYKFYFSLDVSDSEKEVFAQTFSRHLVALCKEQGISLTSKSFDHDYDSWNLYTWDPQKLASVIQMLYPQYKDTGIFRTTKHWMQGSLQGVSPEHVGWVEEPMTTKDRSGMSHSSRMGKLGAALDAGNSYMDACALAGVNATEPWKLLREEEK